MSDYVEVDVGGLILTFAAADAVVDQDFEPTSVGERVRKSFDEVFEPLRVFAGGISSKIDSIKPKPAEVEVKVGLTISADAGVIFAQAGTEAALEVTLKWKTP